MGGIEESYELEAGGESWWDSGDCDEWLPINLVASVQVPDT